MPINQERHKNLPVDELKLSPVIPEHSKHNFEQIERAFALGKVGIVRAKRIGTDTYHSLLTLIQTDEDGLVHTSPFAEMIEYAHYADTYEEPTFPEHTLVTDDKEV